MQLLKILFFPFLFLLLFLYLLSINLFINFIVILIKKPKHNIKDVYEELINVFSNINVDEFYDGIKIFKR